ncbi:hypothetical protein BVX97_05625 [bacterium E08(2017)]|nr:hypothetical protein BVX97_05625 [bacterium E08(2017)]
MKIALDARWIFPEISGIGAYTREIIKQFAEIDKENSFVFLFNDESVMERTISETGLKPGPHFSTELVPYSLFSIANQLKLGGLLKELKVDLYHSTNYMIPLPAFPANKPGKIRCVTTIHDVIPMIFRNHAPKSRKARLYPLYSWLMIEMGRRSDTIITDSRASAADIIKHLKIPPSRSDRVKPIYCGVSNIFMPPETRKTTSDNAAQILYVGRSDPYKNITTLIRAFEKIRNHYKHPAKLIIAGSLDPRYSDTQTLAVDLGLENDVQWTGYISDDELVRLYQESSLLIHPSRYEGFGLQILEAMSCGLPVICANKGSQPEVAGDAAIVLDPDDEAGMVDNALRILNDPAKAESMREKGFEQCARFSWRKTAEQILDVYKETFNDTNRLALH